MTLPSGTLLFLFTDIEGSTGLWEKNPDAMSAALARHDMLMRQAIESNDGYVFKTMGDAFCAVFTNARDAANAATAAQFALALNENTSQSITRVRMALHTGEAEIRDNDYFGPTLNRCARILATGHGGQILVSESASILVQDAPHDLGVTFLALGEHRLKDLSRPERLFQLLHPNLPFDFPALRSLDHPALLNNLPLQVTEFVGREQEVEATKQLLKKSRLVTIVGSGGIGKTRLALQAAAELLESDGDSVRFVELAGVTDAAMVPQTVANVLGIRQMPSQSLAQAIVAELRSQRALLILDNCEHLLGACAQLADTIVRGCPQVRLLVTSRETLGISGETTYRIQGLSVVGVGGNYEIARSSEAVRLFESRAASTVPSFELTPANIASVSEICERLDGIPLGIELAASRVRSLGVEEINERLKASFRLLTGGARDHALRQQTLQATIDWSYALLNESERIVLCRLSLFVGGFTLNAAEQICSDEQIEQADILDLLTSLVDKSLVIANTYTGMGRTRYRLLEVVRHFGIGRMNNPLDAEALRQKRHAYFAALVDEAGSHLSGPDQAVWLDALESDHHNIRQALGCADAGCVGAERLKMAVNLARFWHIRGHWAEGRKWIELLLDEAGETADTAIVAGAANSGGALAWSQGDLAAAEPLFKRSLEARMAAGDEKGQADVLSNLGLVAKGRNDFDGARSLLNESLEIRRRLGDRLGVASSLCNLGLTAHQSKSYEEAAHHFDDSLLIYRDMGDTRGIAMCLVNRGIVRTEEHRYENAREDLTLSASMFEELGDSAAVAATEDALAELAFLQGDCAMAAEHNRRGILTRRELGESQGLAQALILKAQIAEQSGDAITQTESLLEAAELLLNSGGITAASSAIIALKRAAADHRNTELDLELAALDGLSARRCRQAGEFPDESEDFEKAVTCIHTVRRLFELWLLSIETNDPKLQDAMATGNKVRGD